MPIENLAYNLGLKNEVQTKWRLTAHSEPEKAFFKPICLVLHTC